MAQGVEGMSEVNWSAIRAEYENGSSLRQLAAKYGVSKSAIGERKYKEQWTERTPDTGHRTLDTKHAGNVVHPTPKKNLSTKDRQRLFLEAYAEHANILLAARAAGIHRSTVYDWQEHDEDFSFAFHQAKEDAKDTLRAEIYRRAHDGWEEPLASAGMLVGKVRRYSDTLLIFHAKMLMPEYRDKQQIDVNTKTSAQDAQTVHDAVMKALEPYPEAKWALAEALAELEKNEPRKIGKS